MSSGNVKHFQVQYVITVAKNGDIQSALARIYQRDVQVSEQYFSREFSVTYKFTVYTCDTSYFKI